jgi:hypothetical protein
LQQRQASRGSGFDSHASRQACGADGAGPCAACAASHRHPCDSWDAAAAEEGSKSCPPFASALYSLPPSIAAAGEKLPFLAGPCRQQSPAYSLRSQPVCSCVARAPSAWRLPPGLPGLQRPWRGQQGATRSRPSMMAAGLYFPLKRLKLSNSLQVPAVPRLRGRGSAHWRGVPAFLLGEGGSGCARGRQGDTRTVPWRRQEMQPDGVTPFHSSACSRRPPLPRWRELRPVPP